MGCLNMVTKDEKDKFIENINKENKRMNDEEKNENIKGFKGRLNKKVNTHRIISFFDNEIKPAGCVKKVKDDEGIEHLLIVKPLESNTYVYVLDDVKGITQSTNNAKTGMNFINIEGKDFVMDGKPVDEGMLMIINRPIIKEVRAWVKGDRDARSTNDMYNMMLRYFKTFLDLGEDCYYSLLIMTVFQSWVQDLFKSVWYVCITGEFGGGKTSTGEALAKICNHGCTPGDSSVSFISRGIDMLKMVPFLDEFDSIAGEQDSEHYAIIRMGQKKGQPFSRMGDKGGSFQYFDVFGTKIMVVHGQLEDALQSRSLVINVCESEDWKVATVGRALDSASTRLYNELFIWSLSNCSLYKVVDVVDVVDDIIYDNNSSIDEIRKKLVSVYVPEKQAQPLQPPQPNMQKCKLKGRDSEINGNWSSILRVIGEEITSTNTLENDIYKLISLKKDIRDEMRETGIVGMLRDFLVKKYRYFRGNSEYWTEGGFFMISHKYISEEFKKDYRNSGEFITKGNFTGSLKELGFMSGPNGNKRPMKVYDEDDLKKHVRTALIYDEKVQRRLGVKINNFNKEVGLMNSVEDKVNNIGL